jgi:hypothetical protein
MSVIWHLVVGWNKPVMVGIMSEFESRDTYNIPVRNYLMHSCPLSSSFDPLQKLQSSQGGPWVDDFNPVIDIMCNGSTPKSCTAQAPQLFVLATCFCHPCTVPHVKSFHVMSHLWPSLAAFPLVLVSTPHPLRLPRHRPCRLPL